MEFGISAITVEIQMVVVDPERGAGHDDVRPRGAAISAAPAAFCEVPSIGGNGSGVDSATDRQRVGMRVDQSGEHAGTQRSGTDEGDHRPDEQGQPLNQKTGLCGRVWGASRGLDYFEAGNDVDGRPESNRVAVRKRALVTMRSIRVEPERRAGAEDSRLSEAGRVLVCDSFFGTEDGRRPRRDGPHLSGSRSGGKPG
jgi:hypothetical protein